MSPTAKPMSVPTRRRIPGFSSAPPAAGPATEAPAPTLEAVEPTEATTPTAVSVGAAPDPSPSGTEPARRPRAKRDRASDDPPGAASGTRAVEPLAKPGGFRHQTNFRLYETEMSFLRQQLRRFEDDGIKTDQTELVHALLYAARRNEFELLALLRRWREDLNAI